MAGREITDCSKKIDFLLGRLAKRRNRTRITKTQMYNEVIKASDGEIHTASALKSAITTYEKLTDTQERLIAKYLQFDPNIASWSAGTLEHFVLDLATLDKTETSKVSTLSANAGAPVNHYPRLAAMSIEVPQFGDNSSVPMIAVLEFDAYSLESAIKLTLNHVLVTLDLSRCSAKANNRLGANGDHVLGNGLTIYARGGSYQPHWHVSSSTGRLTQHFGDEVCALAGPMPGESCTFRMLATPMDFASEGPVDLDISAAKAKLLKRLGVLAYSSDEGTNSDDIELAVQHVQFTDARL